MGGGWRLGKDAIDIVFHSSYMISTEKKNWTNWLPKLPGQKHSILQFN